MKTEKSEKELSKELKEVLRMFVFFECFQGFGVWFGEDGKQQE